MAWTGEEVLVADVWVSVTTSKSRRGSKAFDPATKVWRTIRDPPTPDPLYGTGLWTGREMLVWRQGCHEPLRRALAYDPAADDWRYLPPGPISEGGGRAAWVDETMFVWGGARGQFGGYGNDAAFYDPATDQWVAVPPAPLAARTASAMACDATRVFVWGGRVDWGMAASDGAIYDTQDGTWEPCPSAPISARWGPSSVWTDNEFIVWSGTHVIRDRERRVRNGAAYNPATNTWRTVSTSPTSNGGGLYGGSPMFWVGNEAVTWGVGSEYEPAGGYVLGYRPDDDTWRWVPDDGATPGGPGVWAGTELYVWIPVDPRHDLAVYRPELG